jgi:hypothetical protein
LEVRPAASHSPWRALPPGCCWSAAGPPPGQGQHKRAAAGCRATGAWLAPKPSRAPPRARAHAAATAPPSSAPPPQTRTRTHARPCRRQPGGHQGARVLLRGARVPGAHEHTRLPRRPARHRHHRGWARPAQQGPGEARGLAGHVPLRLLPAPCAASARALAGGVQEPARFGEARMPLLMMMMLTDAFSAPPPPLPCLTPYPPTPPHPCPSTPSPTPGAGLLNALELVGKDIGDIRVVVCGCGAAGYTCATYFVTLGVRRENLLAVDVQGVVRRWGWGWGWDWGRGRPLGLGCLLPAPLVGWLVKIARCSGAGGCWGQRRDQPASCLHGPLPSRSHDGGQHERRTCRTYACLPTARHPPAGRCTGAALTWRRSPTATCTTWRWTRNCARCARRWRAPTSSWASLPAT